MVQYCPNCEAPNSANYRFCSNCGAVLQPGASTEVANETVADASTLSAEQLPVRYVVQRWGGTPVPPEAPPDAETLMAPDSPHVFIPPPPVTGGGAGTVPPPPAPYGGVQPVRRPGRGELPFATRKDGELYTPHGAMIARELRTAKPNRSWLLPIIITASLVLLVLAGTAGYLLLSGRAGSTAITIDECHLPPNPTEEDHVKHVVCVSNKEQIQAWRTLDTEALRGTRTGEVLRENIQFVEELRKQGRYAKPMLLRLDILSIDVKDNSATVRTVETWSVTVYDRQTDEVVEQHGPDTYAETYYLVKQDGKWLIEELDFGEGVEG